MPQTPPQSASKHARYDPVFHFFLLPVFAISWFASVVACFRHPVFSSAWNIVFVTAVLMLAFKARLYALKVQDRVIRLEERLRLQALMPDGQQAEIAALDERQLIALRFASDDEAAALAQRAAREHLSSADIKQAVVNWRADHWRV